MNATIANTQLVLKLSKTIDLSKDEGIIMFANYVQKIVEFEQKYPYSNLLETCNNMSDIDRIMVYADADYCGYS